MVISDYPVVPPGGDDAECTLITVQMPICPIPPKETPPEEETPPPPEEETPPPPEEETPPPPQEEETPPPPLPPMPFAATDVVLLGTGEEADVADSGSDNSGPGAAAGLVGGALGLGALGALVVWRRRVAHSQP